MNRFALFAAAPLALGLASCATVSEPGPASASTYAAAVASPDRPAEARALDASRKPTEVLHWLGIRRSMDVADLISGTGYWAEIMAHVVGPEGSVVAYEPNQFYNDEQGKALWTGIASRTPTVQLVRYPFEAFAPPARAFDAALINLSYHDLYWQSEQYKIPRTDPDAWVRALYAAMRPGGVVGVIDHMGNPGTETRALVDKLHRIDPAVVRADFERAGFRLEGTSDLLANSTDDRTKLVFDPAVRGKTDRFMMKFVKPR